MAGQLNRGHDGVGLIRNHLLRNEIRDMYDKSTIQTMSMKKATMMVSVVYIGPRATEEEEIEFLDRVDRLAGTRAVITGDMNARHSA